MLMILLLVSLIKTFPCVAAFMSSLTIVCVALDRFRCIVQSDRTQVGQLPILGLFHTFHCNNTNPIVSFVIWVYVSSGNLYQAIIIFKHNLINILIWQMAMKLSRHG